MSFRKKGFIVCVFSAAALMIVFIILIMAKNKSEIIVPVSYQDNAIYLSPHYSLSIDEFSNEVEATKYSIENDMFEIVFNSSTGILKNISTENPQYMQEKIDSKITVYDNRKLDVSKFQIRQSYAVKTMDGEDTGYRIYAMDNEIWIGHWDYYGENKDVWWCEYIYRVDDAVAVDKIKDVIKMI